MNQDNLETQVFQSLELMWQKYQQLDALADQILVNGDSAEAMEATTMQLKTERESLEKLETDSRLIKEEYRRTRPHASEDVNRITEKLAMLMQRFLMKISKLETQAQRSRESLKPLIHDGVRAVQMKNAYGKYV